METVRTLGREYSMAILGATETPASVASLSESLDIPIATCYRRVSELTTVGLLDEHRSDNESSSKATRYQRTTSAVAIRFGPAPSLWARAFVLVADDANESPLAMSPNNERRSQVRSARVSVPIRGSEAAKERPKPATND
ncbi:helix-turn-helix domain-containing protein [Halorubrum ejinorense]